MRKLISLMSAITIGISGPALSGVDSDFKERPVERFSMYTGDGNYKQAYHWAFNAGGTGPAVTVFLNHGSGGEWYDEIDTEFGPCGPDYLSAHGDFDGSAWAGLCETDELGNELYLADFAQSHVPVGPELEEFMLRKIVGSTRFAAWYWQDAFQQFDSPVHIFMVGRYNVVKEASHLDNVLYWLNLSDENSLTRNSEPPYNLDGYGVKDIDGENRPFHTAPDISGFDNMFLYKAVKEQFPHVSLENIFIEGRSNGGSAMIALASDYTIWPEHIRDFWARNLASEPAPEEIPTPSPTLTVDTILNTPEYLTAFEQMLSNITEADLQQVLANGFTLQLSANGNEVASVAATDTTPPLQPGEGTFNAQTFSDDLSNFIGGDFYQNSKLVSIFYPGCRLDGLMESDANLQNGEVAVDGDNNLGYQVAIKTLFSFGENDAIYTSWCDDRVSQGQSPSTLTEAFIPSDIAVGNEKVIGEVFSPSGHGFDYKDVYKNLPHRSTGDQEKAAEARRAIERVLNQAILEAGLQGSYQLPYDLD